MKKRAARRAVEKSVKTSRGQKGRKEALLAFYWAVKDNAPARDAINWDKFSEYADSAGLYYHPVLGLMEKRVWSVVKEFVVV